MSEAKTRGRGLQLARRAGLWLIALFLIRLSGGFAAVTGFGNVSATGSVRLEVWLRPMILSLIAGGLLVFAVRPWRRARAYRWMAPIVLGLLPALALAIQIWVFLDVTHLNETGFMGAVIKMLFNYFPFPLPALLLGIALMSGIVERTDEPPQDRQPQPASAD